MRILVIKDLNVKTDSLKNVLIDEYISFPRFACLIYKHWCWICILLLGK